MTLRFCTPPSQSLELPLRIISAMEGAITDRTDVTHLAEWLGSGIFVVYFT